MLAQGPGSGEETRSRSPRIDRGNREARAGAQGYTLRSIEMPEMDAKKHDEIMTGFGRMIFGMLCDVLLLPADDDAYARRTVTLPDGHGGKDRKSTRLNSSHGYIS